MGNIKSSKKLHRKTVNDLRDRTQMTEKELKDWHQAFVKDYPSGKLTVDQFKNIYNKFFPNGDAGYFAEQIFSSFDNNNDGFVDFREFMTGLAVFKKGSVDDKLKWAFSMYDLDKNGQISHSEMLEVVGAIYKMVGDNVDLPEDESTPEKRVNKIFSSVDTDHDGFLTLEEFLEVATKDKTIRSLLRCTK